MKNAIKTLTKGSIMAKSIKNPLKVLNDNWDCNTVFKYDLGDRMDYSTICIVNESGSCKWVTENGRCSSTCRFPQIYKTECDAEYDKGYRQALDDEHERLLDESFND